MVYWFIGRPDTAGKNIKSCFHVFHTLHSHPRRQIFGKYLSHSRYLRQLISLWFLTVCEDQALRLHCHLMWLTDEGLLCCGTGWNRSAATGLRGLRAVVTPRDRPFHPYISVMEQPGLTSDCCYLHSSVTKTPNLVTQLKGLKLFMFCTVCNLQYLHLLLVYWRETSNKTKKSTRNGICSSTANCSLLQSRSTDWHTCM